MSVIVSIRAATQPSPRIVVRAPFECKSALDSVAGARWDKINRLTVYPFSPAAARDLVRELTFYPEWTVEVSDEIKELLERAELEAGAADHKTAEDLAEIPGKLPAWLHQRQAYHFAFPRNFTNLDMYMGSGKSRVTVSLFDGWDVDLAIILAPRSVLRVWPNQFATHSERDWHVIVAPMKLSVTKRVEHIRREMIRSMGRPVAIVLNYEAAWRKPMGPFLLDLARQRRPRVALDESHRIKSPGGTASKWAAQLTKLCRQRLTLTGTPMPHGPMDLYAQARAGDPGIFGTSFHAYKHRYGILGGFEGRQVVAYQREDELARKFASYSYIFTQQDLRKLGLSPGEPVHMTRPVELDTRTRKAYDILDADFQLGVEGGTVTVANALVKLIRLQQLTSGYVRDDDGVDHEVGSDKLKVLADVIEDLAVDMPLIIFARFIHDIEAIDVLCRATGRRVGIVSGDYGPGHVRHGLDEDSRMREDIDVCILQLQSGGVGVDLTRAATAIYFSLDFSLGNFDQSMSRYDRPGQKLPTVAIHLIATKTKDEVVYKALQERRAVIEAVIEEALNPKESRAHP